MRITRLCRDNLCAVLVLILVAAVFLPGQARAQGEGISSDLPTSGQLGDALSFGVTTTAGDQAGTEVYIRFTLSDPGLSSDVELSYKPTPSYSQIMTFTSGVSDWWMSPLSLADETLSFEFIFHRETPCDITIELVRASDDHVMAVTVKSISISTPAFSEAASMYLRDAVTSDPVGEATVYFYRKLTYYQGYIHQTDLAHGWTDLQWMLNSWGNRGDGFDAVAFGYSPLSIAASDYSSHASVFDLQPLTAATGKDVSVYIPVVGDPAYPVDGIPYSLDYIITGAEGEKRQIPALGLFTTELTTSNGIEIPTKGMPYGDYQALLALWSVDNKPMPYRINYSSQLTLFEVSSSTPNALTLDSIQLEPAAAVRVTLLDESGNPITGVSAQYEHAAAFNSFIEPDTSGQFYINSIDSSGLYDISVTASGYGTRAFSANLVTGSVVDQTVQFIDPAVAVSEDKTALQVGYGTGDSASSVTQNLSLATSGAKGSTISWQSSNPAVVSSAGAVSRTGQNEQVTLTATISCDGVTDSKQFSVTVLGVVTVDSTLEKATINRETGFHVSTTEGDFLGELVRIRFRLADPAQAEDLVLKYYDSVEGSYYLMTFDANGHAWYGPSAGFALTTASYQFRASMAEVGTYSYGVDVYRVGDGSILATMSGAATVSKPAPKPTWVLGAVDLEPASMEIAPGESVRFSSVVTDTKGRTHIGVYQVWSCSIGQVDESGLYTAPSDIEEETVATVEVLANFAGVIKRDTAEISIMPEYDSVGQDSLVTRVDLVNLGAGDEEVRALIDEHGDTLMELGIGAGIVGSAIPAAGDGSDGEPTGDGLTVVPDVMVRLAVLPLEQLGAAASLVDGQGIVAPGGTFVEISIKRTDTDASLMMLQQPVRVSFRIPLLAADESEDVKAFSQVLVSRYNPDLGIWQPLPSYRDRESREVWAFSDRTGLFAPLVRWDIGGVSDVAGHSEEEHILKLMAMGVMVGQRGDSFSPDEPVTRQQLAKALVEALDLSTGADGALAAFSDSEEIDEWARPYVAAAVEHSLIEGVGGDRLAPTERMTRAQAVTIIVRALDLKVDLGKTHFIDDLAIPRWARTAVNHALDKGILTPGDYEEFGPDEVITRAETARILARLIDYLATR